MNTFIKTGLALSVVLACGFAALPRDTAAAFDSPLATATPDPIIAVLLTVMATHEAQPTIVSPLATPAAPPSRPTPIAPDQPGAVCGADLITDYGEPCTS